MRQQIMQSSKVHSSDSVTLFGVPSTIQKCAVEVVSDEVASEFLPFYEHAAVNSDL